MISVNHSNSDVHVTRGDEPIYVLEYGENSNDISLIQELSLISTENTDCHETQGCQPMYVLEYTNESATDISLIQDLSLMSEENSLVEQMMNISSLSGTLEPHSMTSASTPTQIVPVADAKSVKSEDLWIGVGTPTIMFRYAKQNHNDFYKKTTEYIENAAKNSLSASMEQTHLSRTSSRLSPSMSLAEKTELINNATCGSSERVPSNNHSSMGSSEVHTMPSHSQEQHTETDNFQVNLKNGPTDRGISIRPKQPPKADAKQCYDKTIFCIFCEKQINSKISRHLLNCHKDEPEVYRIQFLEKRSPERIMRLEMLANEGNFRHNAAVIKTGTGELVIARRSSLHEYKPSDYLPCEFCKKFIVKRLLWSHVRNCKVRIHKGVDSQSCGEEEDEKMKVGEGNYIRRGQMLLKSVTNDSDEDVLSSLYDRMHDDDIKRIVMTDALLRKYASTNGHSDRYISVRY